MVRIRAKDGFWGVLVVALLWGCFWVGLEPERFPVWQRALIGGCAFAMLMFAPIRDLVRAWLETEK
jgi:hypothetical protein